MTYVRKIVAKDEELIGVARLHWIYVIKGLTWFLVMAVAGWGINSLITRGLAMIGNATNTYAVPSTLMSMSHGVMFFLMAGGFFIFFLFVLKVLVTEVALTSRRVILKEGLIFVKVKQVDLEEIRGENMDMGHLGRMLGYGYLMLDCRFIGDIKLPAIENPERFLRALHAARGKTQDAIGLVIGKGNKIAIAPSDTDSPDSPEMKPNEPTPEIQPGQPEGPEANPPAGPKGPEIPAMPVPHNPPAGPPPQQPVPPPEQPAQPVPPPFNPEPPLQPPSGVQAMPAQMTSEQLQALTAQRHEHGIQPAEKAIVDAQLSSQQIQQVQAAVQKELQNQQAMHAHDQIVPPQQPVQQITLGPDAVAQVVQQIMPEMAQQVVKQMAAQGIIHPDEPANDHDKDIDKELMTSFDVARLHKDEHGNDLHDKVEYAIH